MKLLDGEERRKQIQKCVTSRENVVTSLTTSVDPSSWAFLLYELNAWIGGPGDRVLTLIDLAGFQPSFDHLWHRVLLEEPSALTLPLVVKFGTFPYQIVDQVAEEREQTEEVQLLLGCLSLAATGSAHCILSSSESDRKIEIFEDCISLLSGSKAGVLSATGVFLKYGLRIE